MNNTPPRVVDAKPPVIAKQKRRWLLWLARRCYFWFLRANGWRCVFSPNPLKGGGLIMQWQKVFGAKRFQASTEEALMIESKLHQQRLRQELAAD